MRDNLFLFFFKQVVAGWIEMTTGNLEDNLVLNISGEVANVTLLIPCKIRMAGDLW